MSIALRRLGIKPSRILPQPRRQLLKPRQL